MAIVRRHQRPAAKRANSSFFIGHVVPSSRNVPRSSFFTPLKPWHCFFTIDAMDEASEQKRLRRPVVFYLLRRAFVKLAHNDPLRMAGATAFFTSFALPFILIILVQLLGLFYNERIVRGELFQTLSGAFGRNAVRQVVSVLRAFRQLADNPLVTVVGVLFLFLVSTTLLMVLKSSINQLWRIKVLPGRGFLSTLGIRLQSLLIIIGTAVLFLLSILAEGLKAYLDHTITTVLPAFAHYFIGVLNYVFSVFFVALWFVVIFRLLPDAKAPWKVAFTGAVVTSLLFNLGKYILRVLLVNSNIGTLYGASTSVVLLLLFVFYSSLILYFGAAFTRVWAEHIGAPIKPRPYATHYKLTDVGENA